jgi:hypothetical protein
LRCPLTLLHLPLLLLLPLLLSPLLLHYVCSKLWGCAGELYNMIDSIGSRHLLTLLTLLLPLPLLLLHHCSKLWGCAGELYNVINSTGSRRLLDWSYAGYMAGEAPIPKLPVVTSVTVRESGAASAWDACIFCIHIMCLLLFASGHQCHG